MTLPKWIEDLPGRRPHAFEDCKEGQLIKALSIAWEAMEKSIDLCGRTDSCDPLEEAMRRIEEIGK